MQTVALIDYGSGNLHSAAKALQAAAASAADAVQVVTTADPDAIASADRLVLPGVGAFSACMDALESRPRAIEAMEHAVKSRGAPFLGVCVGMQLLARRGLEIGERAGLGWIDGEVRRLEPHDAGCKVPHMGWNDVEPTAHPLLDPSRPAAMYFTHSFAFHPDNDEAIIGVTDHGGRFAAAVARDNIAGVQFHPEKSQGAGLELISRFLAWRP